MAIVQISKIQQRSGNIVDLPQLDEAELGWATDAKQLYIGKTEHTEGFLQKGAEGTEGGGLAAKRRKRRKNRRAEGRGRMAEGGGLMPDGGRRRTDWPRKSARGAEVGWKDGGRTAEDG